MPFRIGLGYDVHTLQKGYPLFLGGVKIPSDFGAVGHSDADTLLHAICDAILGAINLRDIGYHFPDSSGEFKGIDSRKLLEKVWNMMNREGYGITNIDSVIVLQQPKIAPFIDDIRDSIASVLKISSSRISVKATTTEKLGFEGKGEGVAVQAVVLLHKIQPE